MKSTNDKHIPNRILIAAPKSGSGKTMITCGLLNLIKDRGMDVTSFKCGPDYIDPMFHKKVLGIYGGNLDTFFCSRDKVKEILLSCGHENAVIEGVMGIYDGLGGLLPEGSCYDIAGATDTPIILVVDGKGAGRSLVSTIKGFLLDDTSHLIKGIILNRVSPTFYQRLKDLLAKELGKVSPDIRLLGALPEIKDITIDSRHLGLLRPDEIEDIREKISAVSEAISENLDVDGIFAIMGDHVKCPDEATKDESNSKENSIVNLAVAMDDAFCFYYKENLTLLENLGANIIYFSPLKDKKIPDNIQGLYIGGGYPELHLKELTENTSMRESIKNAVKNGLPTIAECGGFMYLHDQIVSPEGVTYDMVGAVGGICSKKDRLVRFGYVELAHEALTVETNNVPGADNKPGLAPFLSGIRGHEFHYYDSTDNGSGMTAKKAGDEKTWSAMHVTGNSVLGFPHLYFESKPEFAKAFVEKMRDVR